jgi:hypothetical protein
MRLRVNWQELIGGLVVMSLGAAFLWMSLEYRMGTARRMGPGYFPHALAWILIGLGLIQTLLAARGQRGFPEVDWRAAAAVLLAIAAFGVSLVTVGLGPAIVLTVLISGLGDRRSTLLQSLGLAAGMAVFCWLVFSVMLGLPLPLVRAPW